MRQFEISDKYILDTNEDRWAEEDGDIVTIIEVIEEGVEVKVYLPYPKKYIHVHPDELLEPEIKVFLWDDYLNTPKPDQNIKAIHILPWGKYDHGTLLEINGTTYGISATMARKGRVIVQEIDGVDMNRVSIDFAEDIHCPYCNTKLSDSWEYSDEGTELCEYCATEFNYTRHIETSYSTQLVTVGHPTRLVEPKDI